MGVTDEPRDDGSEFARQKLLDPLTGLPNRALFYDRLDQRLREVARDAQPFCLLIVDVEHLDTIAGGISPQAADRVLRSLAERLRDTLRESDTLARLYGDTFAALLPATHDLMGIHVLCERIGQAVCAPIELDGERIELNASIGAAQWPEHGDDRHALLQHADRALAEARRGATCGAIFTREPNARQERSARLVRDLSRAIEEHEFVVHYQPQVDLATGHANGVEALVRWRHPDLGLLPPVDFIPAAENSAAILPLTLQILDQVLAQAAAWRAQGLVLPVAVNLSPKVLNERRLVERIVECQQRHDVPANMLTLEIPESGVHGPAEHVARILRALSMADFRIAIDDFGTGFSSLKCLRSLPVDEIKIDPLFTASAGNTDREACIVRAIVELARGFDARVVAEGIESERASRLLEELGCSHGQGFHLCPALPAAECEAWCRRHAAPVLDDDGGAMPPNGRVAVPH